MRRFAVVLVGFAALSMIHPAATAAEGSGPRIEIKEERHDFGKVAQGTEAVHVFEMRNAGDEPLLIERVQTS